MAKMKLFKNPRPIKHNPAKFKENMRRLPHEDAIDVAEHWKSKAAAIQNEMQVSTQNALELAIGGGTAFSLGYLSGGWRQERDQLIAQYGSKEALDQSDQDDPTEIWGLPKTLLAAFALGVGSVLGVGGKKFQPGIRAAAGGALGTWATETGMDMGYESAKNNPSA